MPEAARCSDTLAGVLDTCPECASAVVLNELDSGDSCDRLLTLLLLRADCADPLTGEWPAVDFTLHCGMNLAPDCVQLLEMVVEQEKSQMPLADALQAQADLEIARDGGGGAWTGEDPAQCASRSARAPVWAHARAVLAACERGDAAEVEALLAAQRTAVGAVDERGRSAMHYTAARGHVAEARLLLARGALPHLTDSDGMTALHLAAAAGHAEV